ncbi:MAG: response regulator [Pseudomonadota bacterium]
MTRQVLLVEDDDALRESMRQTLDLEGISVIATSHFVQARRAVRANFNGVVLTDIRMPGHDGFDVLAMVQAADTELPVIMLTGEGDVPMAIRAMKEGAYDFLEKPCATDHLLGVLNRAMDHRGLVLKTRAMERRLKRSDLASINFPGDSAVSRALRADLRRAAESGSHILLSGPDGVGKKQASHTLFHLMGVGGRFQPVNWPFEHDFVPADDTTVLSIKHTERADGWERIAQILLARPDLRLIAHTTHGLPSGAEGFDFVTITIPDLGARHADLPIIFEEVLRQAARNADKDMPPIRSDIAAYVASTHWSGNLAELRAFANVYLRGETDAPKRQSLAERMERYERSVLEDALRRHEGKAVAAAMELGLPRKTFYDRAARYGLRPKDFSVKRLSGD